MMLDILPCQNPEPELFEELLLHKLLLVDRHTQVIQPAQATAAGRCFLMKTIAATQLVAAHPGSGESALNAALQCLQQQALPNNTQVILLSANPPPALEWLSQHQSLAWCRCQVLAVNNDYGILIEDSDSLLTTTDNSLSPARLQRTATATSINDGLALTEEEQQFFSHL